MATKKNVQYPSGTWLVYGMRGSGKTMFASLYPGDPKKVLYIDADARKNYENATALGFDYIDLIELTKGMTEVKRFDTIKTFVENIKKNQYDLIVIDNPVIFTDGAFGYVVSNMSKFKDIVRGNAAIIGAIQWKLAREVALPALYQVLRQKSRMVLFLAHEKAQSVEGVKTGGMEAHVDPSLFKACSPIVRLVFGDKTPVPIGLMVKGLSQVVNGKLQNVLPLRVEQFTWETIFGYMENPIGTRSLDKTAGEVPDEVEYALIRSALTPEQRRLFEFNMAMASMKGSLKNEQELIDSIVLVSQNLGPIDSIIVAAGVVDQLKGDFPDLTPQKVMEVSASLKKAAQA